MTTGYINMGDGSNKMEASAKIVAGTIVSGAGSDTFTTSSDFGSASDTRIGTGSGNDSLYFAGNVSSVANVNAGAGNDTLQFTELVSSASIVGGAGNDSLSFTYEAATSNSTASGGGGNLANEYFYGGGTDTLFFYGNSSQSGTVLNVNVLDSLYTSVATQVRTGTGINIVGTTGSTSTTIAYVLGTSLASQITATEVSQSTIDSVTSLG